MKTIFKTFFLFSFLLFTSVNIVYALYCPEDIRGTVKDPQQIPVEEVTITIIVDSFPLSPSYVTQPNGTFIHPYPVNGEVTLSATKNNYLPITSTVPVCTGNIFVIVPENIPTNPPGQEPRCGMACQDYEQCLSPSDGCSYCFSGRCIDPEKIPPPTPNITPFFDQAIDFDKLKQDLITAVPSIKPEFLGGASNVYPILSDVLKYVYVIAGLLLLFYLIAGGFHMMVAARDEKGLVEAKGKITNALIGFLILFLSYWVVQIVEYILGIQIF